MEGAGSTPEVRPVLLATFSNPVLNCGKPVIAGGGEAWDAFQPWGPRAA